MIFRNLDAAGDWTFGHGRQDYLTRENAVAMNIRTRLQCFLNDCFWAMGFGIDWWNLEGSKNPTAQVAILVATRTMLATSYGVVRITSVDVTTDLRTRLLTLFFETDTIYSRGSRQAVTIIPN